MFDYESFGLLHMLVMGHAGFAAFFIVMGGTCRTVIKDEDIVRLPRKENIIGEWAILAIMLPFMFLSLWMTVPIIMDIPGVMAVKYRNMEGIVKEMRYGSEEGGRAMSGELSVEDGEGKFYQFRNIHVPRFLEIGDRVKVDYRRYGKSGVIREINGEVLLKHQRSARGGLFVFIMAFLMLAMPWYAFRMFKCKPFFNREEDYSICVYHAPFVKTIWAVEILMLQSMAVICSSVLRIHGRVVDVYWGLLVSGIYMGMLCLSYLRQKRFILIKGRFYYRSFQQRLEGSLEEIETVERREKGVVIRAKGKEMEIRCTSEPYVEALMGKIGERGKTD